MSLADILKAKEQLDLHEALLKRCADIDAIEARRRMGYHFQAPLVPVPVERVKRVPENRARTFLTARYEVMSDAPEYQVRTELGDVLFTGTRRGCVSFCARRFDSDSLLVAPTGKFSPVVENSVENACGPQNLVENSQDASNIAAAPAD